MKRVAAACPLSVGGWVQGRTSEVRQTVSRCRGRAPRRQASAYVPHGAGPHLPKGVGVKMSLRRRSEIASGGGDLDGMQARRG